MGKFPKGISLHFSDLIFEKQLLAIVQKIKDHFPWIMKDYFLCFKTNKMLICRQCFRFSFVYDFEHYIFPDVQRGSAYAYASEEGQRLLL